MWQVTMLVQSGHAAAPRKKYVLAWKANRQVLQLHTDLHEASSGITWSGNEGFVMHDAG